MTILVADAFQQILSYKGFDILAATQRHPTTFEIEMVAERVFPDALVYRTSPLRRKISEAEGILNHMLDMAAEMQFAIDQLIVRSELEMA